MKQFLLILALPILLVSWNKVKPKDSDQLLITLEKNLPAGWKMIIRNDSLIIENLEPIWMLSTNLINAPSDAYDDSEENKANILEYGIKTHAQFIFAMKPKIKGDEKKDYSDDANAPNYFSQNYSLHQLESIGCDDVYTRHYPWQIEDEASKIYSQMLSEFLIKIKGPEYPEVNYGRP